MQKTLSHYRILEELGRIERLYQQKLERLEASPRAQSHRFEVVFVFGKILRHRDEFVPNVVPPVLAEFSWLADHGRVTIALSIPMATLQFPR
jgi:hypothetical protein